MGRVPYKTFIYGVEDPELLRVLRNESKLVAGQAVPPRTVNDLKLLSVQDMKSLQAVLGEQGYYDAELDFFVEIETNPVTVYLKINLGRRYTLGAFKIKSAQGVDPQLLSMADNVGMFGVTMGMPASKPKVKGAIEKIIKFLKDHGQPLAKVKEDRMVIDRSSKEMHVALLIDTGPLARFGNAVIERAGGVSADFIKSKLSWKKGDIYNREKIIETIQKLHNSRLFRSIKLTNAEQVNKEGFIDIYVNLDGAPPSEYTIGSEYQPKKDLVTNVKWESRNMTGRGEIMSLGTHFGKSQKTGEVALLIPDFQTVNLDFVTKVRAGKWDFPAYTKKGMEMKSMIQYPIFGPAVLGQAGLSFEINNVEKGGRKENNYRILGLPMAIKYSSIVGGRQPRKGFKIKARVYPYMTVFGKVKSYVRTHITPQLYHPLTKEEDIVFNGWMDAGFTPGSGKSVIPAHKLHYPGGAGSIRGYKFQMASNLDQDNNPKGGRSMLLLGVGVNSYLTDSLTLSGYMDWGNAFDRQYTDFSSGMLWGIGAGIKYHSQYGDLSFDIASPVKRRSVDDAIEFYVTFNVKPGELYRGLYRNITPANIQEQQSVPM